jgi:DNA mismatch repair ATPase MutS
MDFYNDISSDTLLLLDEMFSTTSSFEGGIISTHVLKKLALSGCKCIYTTHLHELAYKADEINASADIKSRIDNLSAQVTDGICTYKILRKRDNYGSLADAICKKYGFLT